MCTPKGAAPISSPSCWNGPNCLGLAVLLFVFARGVAGFSQQAQLAVENPPYYIQEPVLLRVVLQDFEESPQPEIEYPTLPDGVRVQLQSASPKVSRSVQIVQDSITGAPRMSEQRTVVWQIDYLVTATKIGEYSVGPFSAKQANRQARAEAITLSFEDVPRDADMRIHVILPAKPVYPDQRVAVTIQWWYAGDVEAIDKLRIYSPVFDQFRFLPDSRPDRQAAVLPIETKEGQVGLAATARRETEDGKTFTVVTAVRTLIPGEPGTYAVEPAMATVRKVTRWRRDSSPFDDFGFGSGLLRDFMGEGRRPAQTQLTRAIDTARTLVVKPFPEQSRPASFAGAVGAGFAIDVSADRTVVRVGDPITLTVAVRGEGNLEDLALPPLTVEGGLDPQRFRLPSGELAGTFAEGTKRFVLPVRVEDENVSEIPALSLSWFDPAKEGYQTAQSKPIALRVLPAKIVSAADVVSKTPSVAPKAAATASAAATSSAPSAPRAPSLSGADLVIERDPVVLLSDGRRAWTDWTWQVGLYLAGAAAIIWAWVDRRRREVPLEVVRHRKMLRLHRRELVRARQLAPREAAATIAAALRSLSAENPQASRVAAESIIAECESLLYAPAGAETQILDQSLVDRALAVADQMAKECA
jgi:hypothetical protein